MGLSHYDIHLSELERLKKLFTYVDVHLSDHMPMTISIEKLINAINGANYVY